MSLYREHSFSEWESRWQKGRRVLRRARATRGYWKQDGVKVEHGSLQPTTSADRMPRWLEKWAAGLDFEAVRVSALRRGRQVRVGRVRLENEIRSLYAEVRWRGQTFTLAQPPGRGSEHDFETWARDLKKYFRLPQVSGGLDFSQVVFSPSAFGYLLHEALGHRLESDDFQDPIAWKKRWQDVGFDVFDSAGEAEWLGYCPFDDAGVQAQTVSLLDGRTGDQEFLSARTGNRRANGFERHALIRQRCTLVKLRQPQAPPEGRARVVIDEIGSAQFLNGEVQLGLARVRYIDQRNRSFRLPPMTLTTDSQIVAHLRAFGEFQTHHPAGGCIKEGQGDLPVSFHAPWAWCQANAPLRFELI